MSTPHQSTTGVSLVFVSTVAGREEWRAVLRGTIQGIAFHSKADAESYLDSLLEIERVNAEEAQLPIQRVLRSKSTIRWLRADLPGCGNDLHDLAQGYASWLSAPMDEIAVADYLIEDTDFALDFVYPRFKDQIEAHSMGLL